MSYVGRLAPSPTGRIHVGVARTCLAAWLDARRAGGRLLLRIEDIDRARTVEGAATQIMRDLEWLGLDWDGEVVFQSDRFDRYQAALDRLTAADRLYPCTCSRKEIALASAPHPGEEGPRYPGTCRGGFRPRPGRKPALRLRTLPGDVVAHVDRLAGAMEQDVFQEVGDFVVKRADEMWAYQLAVTVDDLEQGVTCVVRGSDLLFSTPRQLLLRRLLDPRAPALRTLHVPLLLGPGGKRLAKRDGAIAVADQREAGLSAPRLVGELAASLGLLSPGTEARPEELIELWAPERLLSEDQVWERT